MGIKKRNSFIQFTVTLLTAAGHSLSAQTSETNNTTARPLAPITVIGEMPRPSADVAPAAPGALDVRGTWSALSLNTLAPNLAAYQGTSDRQPQFSARGLRDNNLAVGEPQVVLYLDDVPYDDIMSRGVALYGLDSVEFRRGPQGTRFGSSAPGGTLDLHTHAPEDAWQGAAAASYSSWQTWRAEVSAGGAIITNTLNLSVAGLYFNREGFVRNLTTGDYGDSRETLAGRVKLHWTPTDRLDVLTTVSAYRYNDGLQPGSPLGTDLYTVARNFDGYDDQTGHTESIRIRYGTDAFDIVSISSFTGWSEKLLADSDYSPFPIASTTLDREVKQWTQEVRVESMAAALMRWQAGGFFAAKSFDTDLATDLTQPFPLTQGSIQNNDDRKYALFGEATRDLGEKFEATAGVRLEYISRDAAGEQTVTSGGFPIQPPVIQSESESFRSVQPRAELAWKVCERARLWLGASRGFQPGGFTLNAAPAPTAYDDSDSWHFELGGSQSSVSGKRNVRASVFYNTIRDYQVFRPTGFGNFGMLNADRAHTAGAEMEASYQPNSHWRISLGGGFVSAKFDEFTDPNTSAVYDDNDINLVPDYTLDATVIWQPDAHWFVSANTQLVGSVWWDEANTTKQGAYGLLNLRAGWQAGHWGVAAFGRNVLDQEYAATAFQFNQPPAGVFFVGTPGEPAVFGIELFARL